MQYYKYLKYLMKQSAAYLFIANRELTELGLSAHYI